MKKFLLTLLGVLIALPALARDFTYEYEGQTLTYTVIDEEAKTCETARNFVIGELIIPSVAKDGDTEYSVTEIGVRAFYACTGLTQVTIPNSVTVIGQKAFYKCFGLTQLTIPNSVKSIGGSAFAYCRLTDITVEALSPALIFESTFYKLYDTATLIIPEGSFDAYISSWWEQFNKIRFANSSELIDYTTFDDGVLTYRLNTIDKTAIVTGSNTPVITIPERFTDDSDPDNPVRYSVTAIGNEAFKDKTIESFAFNSRSKLEYIGVNAFSGSTLKAISLPETVKSIGASAFSGCNGLTEISIGNSVKTIGDYAFRDCTGLTKAEFATIEALCAIEFGNLDANPLWYAHNL